MKRMILILMLVMFATTTYADEPIEQYPLPVVVSGSVTVVPQYVVHDDGLSDLPYSVARQLPDSLYFWWAVYRNEKVQQGTRTPDGPSVSQTEIIRGLDGRTTTIRQRSFTPYRGSGPAMIYNPFVRE